MTQQDDNPFIRSSPWGRAAGPSQPFRLGPLPKAPAPRQPPPPPRPPGPGILSGSLIPQAAPAAPTPEPPAPR